MTERYDSSAARHYAAYRPPLHGLILERLLQAGERFPAGLDVGCGTGYSAVALCRYCDRVIGIDASKAMLDAAQAHPKVTYLPGSLDAPSGLPLPPCDIVSFAGSLFYMKSPALRAALPKVCTEGGTVVVYDFEVLLDDVMAGLGADGPAVVGDYDASINLSDWEEWAPVTRSHERLALDLTAQQLTHLLLSDSNRFDALRKRFPDGDLFESVLGQLNQRTGNHRVSADIHFARYRA